MWFYPYALTVRRLQDTGKSKWWVIVSWSGTLAYTLYAYSSGIMAADAAQTFTSEEAMGVITNPIFIVICAINLITFIALLIFCCMDGNPEPNKFGDSPKYTLVNDEDELQP